MEALFSFTQKNTLVRLVPFLLALTLFSLPLSSTAKSISLTCALLVIISIPAYRADIKQLVAQSYCRAALLLVVFAIIASFWSPANFSEKMLVIEKYSKLLYLPILIIAFQEEKTRLLGIQAFLIAIFITCVLSVLKYHGFLAFIDFDSDHVFRNHIMTGFMVAFAAYLAALFSYRSQGYPRLIYALLTVLFTYQVLAISGGRTGYVLYLIMMILLLMQIGTWRQILIGILAISAVFTGSYFTGTVMKTRVDAIAQQLHDYRHNEKNTDIGLRFQFHDYARGIFLQHPLIGQGTAGFTHRFAQEKPIPFWDRTLLEPHSQYWLVASEFGCLGLMIFFWFFTSLIRAGLKLDQMKCILFAMLIPFMIGSSSDSLLFYSGSGYFFIIFMALCLGESVHKSK